LPEKWNEMSLKNIITFGNRAIDIKVSRASAKIRVDISVNGKQLKHLLIRNGEKVDIKL